MHNPVISVGEDLNRELGYTVFTLSGIEGVVDRISYSIIRHGYDLNYLGEADWQAAFSWLEPEEAWYENNTLKFIVPPAVTWQLESQGYVLRLKLAPNIGEISFDFFWPEVLSTESTSQSSSAQRLSGTRVKPLKSYEEISSVPNSEMFTPIPETISEPNDEEATKQECSAGSPEVRKHSKSSSPALLIFLLVAVIALLGGVYWFFLRPNDVDEFLTVQNKQSAGDLSPKTRDEMSETKMSQKLSSEPIKTEVKEQSIARGAINNNGVKKQESRSEITEVTRLVVAPEKKKPLEEDVNIENQLRSDMQTKETLQDILSQGSTRETTQQTEKFKSIEPALRRKVGE